jgi:hypothetical protein
MQKKYAYIALQFLDIALYLSQLTGLLRTILSIVLTELRCILLVSLPTQNKCTKRSPKGIPTSLKYGYLSQLLRSIQFGEIDGMKKRDMQWKRNSEGGMHINSDIYIFVNSCNQLF